MTLLEDDLPGTLPIRQVNFKCSFPAGKPSCPRLLDGNVFESCAPLLVSSFMCISSDDDNYNIAYCSSCCYWCGSIVWTLVLLSKTNGKHYFYLLWSYIVLNWDTLISHFRLKYCTFLSLYPGLHHETEKCITGNLPSHWPVTSNRECLTVCWTEPLLCGCKWGFPGQAAQLCQTRLLSTRIGTHF